MLKIFDKIVYNTVKTLVQKEKVNTLAYFMVLMFLFFPKYFKVEDD